MSVDYYTRLEQGREINVSDDVLDAVARALRLDGDERVHLTDLTQSTNEHTRPLPAADQRVRGGITTLLDSMTTPAFVLGRRLDVLATNAMTRSLLCDFDALARRDRNHARWVFLDPSARERYLDWETIARDNVAALRMDAGRFPDDMELSSSIGELSVKSPLFAQWWADHQVRRISHGTKRYLHPIVGEITVNYEALPVPDATEQTLYIYSTEPGTPSRDAMQLLANWTFTNDGS